MKQHLQARLIPTPAWAREPETDFYKDEGEGRRIVEAFEPHLPAILARLHEQIEALFNDPGQVFEGGFPEPSHLTGEYYWGDRTYSGFVEPANARPHDRLSLNVRCLEKKLIEHQTDLDYVELEAQILLWRDTGEWELMPGFDVRVI